MADRTAPRPAHRLMTMEENNSPAKKRKDGLLTTLVTSETLKKQSNKRANTDMELPC